MPEHYSLVQFLLDRGFTDVWTLDFRMSNRHGYNMHRNRFNMDDIARFDFPPAFDAVRRHSGPNCRIQRHCGLHCGIRRKSDISSQTFEVGASISIEACSSGATIRPPRSSRPEE